jgi:hypothetical protein
MVISRINVVFTSLSIQDNNYIIQNDARAINT